jgi:hypothetical protein
MVHAGAQEIRVAVGILLAASAKIIDDIVLALTRGNIQRPLEADLRRQMREQLLDARHTERVEHLAAFQIRLR